MIASGLWWFLDVVIAAVRRGAGTRVGKRGRTALLGPGLFAFAMLGASPGFAHQIVPAIADLSEADGQLHLTIRLPLEGVLAGIDLGATKNTNDAPQAARYNALRALSAGELAAKAREFWPEMARRINLTAEGTRLPLQLEGVEVIPAESPDKARESVLTLSATLPPDTRQVRFSWARQFGGIVIRQKGVAAPYTGYLEDGEESAPILLAGGSAESGWQAFTSYVPVGYRHILPLGTDHILFVLGLFFLSTRWRPLLTQVTLFTIAHTITLALASLGIVSVPAAIVEPLIALSITFVAVENIFTTGLSRTRPFVVFGFGLLHGLGFASVLGQFGLPQDAFIPALLGFNVGVELGQLTIIAGAFATVGYWFGKKPWYREVISIPISVAIAVIGAWWVVERTLL